MHRLSSVAFAAAFLLSGGAAVARDGGNGETPACDSFSMTGGEKTIRVFDRDPVGTSIGDLRIGSRELLDAAGKAVGTVYFKSTVATAGGDSGADVLTSEYFVSFADGWIATQSLYELPDAQDTSQRAADAVLVVTGGTGTFAGVAGSVTIQSGEPPTYEFDLSCN